MMGSCIFPMVNSGWVTMVTTYLHIVGSIFEVLECEFLADGRALLECIGRSRFQVHQHWLEDGTQGLHYAIVEELHDAPEVMSNINHNHDNNKNSNAVDNQSAQQRLNQLCRSVRDCMREFISLVGLLTLCSSHPMIWLFIGDDSTAIIS